MNVFGRGSARRGPLAWDDGDAATFSAWMEALAHQGDLPDDDPLALASRSAALSAFAATAGTRWHTASASRRNRRPRAAWLLATAAVLGLASVGVALGSAPGRPLYDARVSAEAITLPGDPIARERVQAARLVARATDAASAVAAGSEAGVQASLDAFAQIASDASVGAVPDADAASVVAMALARIEQVPIAGPGDAASLARAQGAGGRLLGVLRGPDITPVPSSSPSPSPSPSPALTPSPRTSAPGAGGAGSGAGHAGPSSTPAPRGTSAPKAGTGGGFGPGSHHSSPSPSPSTKPSSGSGGGSGSHGGGPGGGSGTEPGTGAGGSATGRGGTIP